MYYKKAELHKYSRIYGHSIVLNIVENLLSVFFKALALIIDFSLYPMCGVKPQCMIQSLSYLNRMISVDCLLVGLAI